MQEMFDFFEKLSGALATMEQSAVEKSAAAEATGGKEEFAELIKNLRTAKGDIEQALVDERKMFAEEEALAQRLAQPPVSLEPPLLFEPPEPPEPEADPKFGWKVRDRLLGEFVKASRQPAFPTRGNFESWIDASVSMAPDLFGDAKAPDDFSRQVHQRAITLGERESIWWACIATIHICNRIDAKLPNEQLQQLGKASSWIADGASSDPTSPTAPFGAVQTVGDAIAVAHALAAHQFPAGARKPFEHPQEAAATAIVLACKLVRHNLLPAVEAEVLELGAEVAAGRRLWPSAGQRPPTADFDGGWSSWMRES